MQEFIEPRKALKQALLGLLAAVLLLGSGLYGITRLLDTEPMRTSSGTVVAQAKAEELALKPPAKPSQPAAPASPATPPAAPGGMPKSGPAACKSSKDGGRCFNWQLKSGTCHWSNAKYPKNVQTAWRINQAPGGFGAKYWNSWCKLGMAESGWRHNALGPYVAIKADDGKARGRACGIMQALPCRKVQGGIKLSPEGQITWMRNYIRERYGNPDKAWQHEISHQWY